MLLLKQLDPLVCRWRSWCRLSRIAEPCLILLRGNVSPHVCAFVQPWVRKMSTAILSQSVRIVCIPTSLYALSRLKRTCQHRRGALMHVYNHTASHLVVVGLIGPIESSCSTFCNARTAKDFHRALKFVTSTNSIGDAIYMERGDVLQGLVFRDH